jgi:hypothetical protein
MNNEVAQQYLADCVATFRGYKKLADKAIAQVMDEQLFITLDSESNSIAIIMKHMAGNMLSRWTDFLTTDGEKPDRDRDAEFVMDPSTTNQEIGTYWERGWNCLIDAVESLQASDLERTITIRGEHHGVVQAINRQLTHYAYHVGQIVFLAKHLRANEWQSLSIPRNRSAAFNAYLSEQKGNKPASTESRFDAAEDFARESEKT